MQQELEQLKSTFLEKIGGVSDAASLEALRVEYLGRKGSLAGLLKQIPTLPDDQRAAMGKLGNEVKRELERAFTSAESGLGSSSSSERIDVTLPAAKPSIGHLHLVTQAIEEISGIFDRLGFVRARHPEVDWDWYAFESLNMPKNHPARDEWETFFVAGPEEASGKRQVSEGAKGKIVLTPHTSNGQVREMEKGNLPIRMININKCYRRQSDVSHAPMFHQFEGLLIDEGISISHLKGVFDFFVKRYFGPDREIRLRPFHFRFTEPSFELDISCAVCKGSAVIDGKRCRMCKRGWHELGGSGMVHPNVLKAGGIDPEKYSGFAFGWGVERTMMMKAGVNIDDIRLLYKNDLRFLSQF